MHESNWGRPPRGWWERGEVPPSAGSGAPEELDATRMRRSESPANSEEHRSESPASQASEEQRGRSRTRTEPNRVRLQSRGGDTYVQKPGQPDREFAAEVNGIRRMAYQVDNMGNEELNTGDIIKAREKGTHPEGFVNLADNAKEIPERVRLQSRGGHTYVQGPAETDPRFAEIVNTTRQGLYEVDSMGDEELDEKDIKSARKGTHVKGFLNLRENAKQMPDRVELMSDEEGTGYKQGLVEKDREMANRINKLREERYGKSEIKERGEKLTEDSINRARKGTHPTGFLKSG